MLPQVIKLKRIALDLFFPQQCIGCGREGAHICHRCLQSLPRITGSVCLKCGKPQSGTGLCAHCIDWDSAIDGMRAPFIFDGVIRRAVHELKYHNLRSLAPAMAHLLYEYYRVNPVPGEVILPVPLHKKRLKERGYNHSAMLAKELGKLTGIIVETDSLLRMGHSIPQARTVNVEERRKNVAGAFMCRDDSLAGKNIILIDDVTTSGATLDSCATALKNAGAGSVWGLTLATEP